MQKCHVKYLRMNIGPSQVYLSLGIIKTLQNFFQKVEKKSRQIYPKLKFYYVTHMQGLQKCSNFLKVPIFYLRKMTKWLFSTVLNMRPYFFLTIFSRGFWDMSHLLPLAPPKKFILLSKFDQNNQKIFTKSSFLWLKTLQFQIHCFSGI